MIRKKINIFKYYSRFKNTTTTTKTTNLFSAKQLFTDVPTKPCTISNSKNKKKRHSTMLELGKNKKKKIKTDELVLVRWRCRARMTFKTIWISYRITRWQFIWTQDNIKKPKILIEIKRKTTFRLYLNKTTRYSFGFWIGLGALNRMFKSCEIVKHKLFL